MKINQIKVLVVAYPDRKFLVMRFTDPMSGRQVAKSTGTTNHREGDLPMTPPRGAGEILSERTKLEYAVDALANRAFSHSTLPTDEAERLKQRVRERCKDLLDEWSKIAFELGKTGVPLQYQAEVGGAQRLLYEFLSPEVKNLPPQNPKMKFRANRSMRDVEPGVALWLKTIEGMEVEDDEA